MSTIHDKGKLALRDLHLGGDTAVDHGRGIGHGAGGVDHGVLDEGRQASEEIRRFTAVDLAKRCDAGIRVVSRPAFGEPHSFVMLFGYRSVDRLKPIKSVSWRDWLESFGKGSEVVDKNAEITNDEDKDFDDNAIYSAEKKMKSLNMYQEDYLWT